MKERSMRKSVCTCLSDPEPTAISSSARRFSNSAIYRDETRQHMAGSDEHPTGHTHKHPRTCLPAFVSFITSNILTFVSYENKNTPNLIAAPKHLIARSSGTFINLSFHFTLADSLNFSCSGLLCSSQSTTPSGPLADAVCLGSPAAVPRLPLAASSWVSRRLRKGKKRRHKRDYNVCLILLCGLLRFVVNCKVVVSVDLLRIVFITFSSPSLTSVTVYFPVYLDFLSFCLTLPLCLLSPSPDFICLPQSSVHQFL